MVRARSGLFRASARPAALTAASRVLNWAAGAPARELVMVVVLALAARLGKGGQGCRE
jgi:hypothetical protein